MLICPVCGKVNAPGTANCDLCGAPLSAAHAMSSGTQSGSNGFHNHASQPVGTGPQGTQGTPSEQFSGPVCPVCRRTNRTASVFCAFCGYRLKPNVVAGSQPMTQPPAFANTAPPIGVAPDESGNLPTGILLKRRYRIMRKIAQGGMG